MRLLTPICLPLIPVLLAIGGCSEKDSAPVAEDTKRRCNGHSALCDRPLNQVTLPTTHNAMSNADAGWFAPNQNHNISAQLEDGIRGLMLDTHDWEGDAYLCHTYCELGAQPLLEGLGEIKAFMSAHPNEVLVIIFQDALSVERMVEALEESGLASLAWTYDGTFPTLGELIDAGTPLVISAESGAPPPGWYHHAWDLIQDTPYSFASAEEFSCSEHRGEPSSPLFLVNHWLSTPLPTEEGAAEVNREDILLARAEACTEARGRPINLLGVDFYDHGDLFEVVDILNGVN